MKLCSSAMPSVPCTKEQLQAIKTRPILIKHSKEDQKRRVISYAEMEKWVRDLEKGKRINAHGFLIGAIPSPILAGPFMIETSYAFDLCTMRIRIGITIHSMLNKNFIKEKFRVFR